VKKCLKCLHWKEVDEFYRHPQTADGRLGTCKTCKKNDTKKNRLAKREYYRKYEQSRASEPHRKELHTDILRVWRFLKRKAKARNQGSQSDAQGR
jgi:hypothetical protein